MLFCELYDGSFQSPADRPTPSYPFRSPRTPGVDVTSIDNAAGALEKRSFFIRKVAIDGYRIGYRPTLKKVVGDRRAALDDADVTKAVAAAVQQEFKRGRTIPVVPGFPTDGSEVEDTPKLKVALLNPDTSWNDGAVRANLAEWTYKRGTSSRLYPAAVVWIVRKPDRGLREKAEMWLAWKRVDEDLKSGILGTEFEAGDKNEVTRQIKESEEALRDEVWASYRYAIVADGQRPDGLREIDLGAGHATSGAGSLTDRVVTALKSEGLLNESIGAAYLERNWPTALKEKGEWPLKGLRQAFMDGSLTRLLDPEEVLRRQIVSFVEKGDAGMASGRQADGAFERVWWKETVRPEEVTFDEQTFLLTRSRAEQIACSNAQPTAGLSGPAAPYLSNPLVLEPPPSSETQRSKPGADETIRLSLLGRIPPEQWNKLGTRLITKLRTSGQNLTLDLNASLTIPLETVSYVENEIRQALRDLGLEGLVRINKSPL